MRPDIEYIDLGGRTRVAHYGGSGDPIVLVHGLGGSIENWNSLGPLLTHLGEVHALDLAGFGESPPEGRATTVRANADLVMRFARVVSDGAPSLIGNSMGGLVSMIAASRHPVQRLVLIDPAVAASPAAFEPRVLRDLMMPTLPLIGPALLRRFWREHTAEELVQVTRDALFVDPSRIDPARTEEALRLAARRKEVPWAAAAFAEAARSIGRETLDRQRFWKLVEAIAAPTLVIHGDSDRLVPPSAIEELARRRPDWTMEILRDVGHVPMLEVPKETADAIDRWWQ